MQVFRYLSLTTIYYRPCAVVSWWTCLIITPTGSLVCWFKREGEEGKRAVHVAGNAPGIAWEWG